MSEHDTTARWDREGDLGEQGTVTVRDTDPATETTRIYRFAAEKRKRTRYHHGRRPEEARRGADRERIEDGGPLAGLVVSFERAQRLVYGRATHSPSDSVPEHVAEELFAQGVAEVRAGE